MGFLSKLFGGDAGPAPSKADGGNAPQSEKKENEAEPSSDAAAKTSAREAVATAGEADAPPPPAKEPVKEAAPKASSEGTPKAAAAKAQRKPAGPTDAAARPTADTERTAPARPAAKSPDKVQTTRGGAVREPAGSKEGAAKGAKEAAPKEAPPKDAAQPPSRPPQAPAARAERTRKPLEESILTSAPKLPLDPTRPEPPPTAVKVAGQATPGAVSKEGDKSEKPSTSSSGLDAAQLAAFRSRRDRSKSPGFYSSVTPAHSTHVASPSSKLKATVVGMGPPVETAARAKADAGTNPAETPANDTAATPVPVPAPGAGAPNVPQPAPSAAQPAPTAPQPPPSAPRSPPSASNASHAASPSDSDAAPPLPVVDLDVKEDTSPGLGNNRSRHDPLALQIPKKDLELLVEFILALAMGTTSEAWLAPARAAVVKLRAGAVRSDRLALDKALGGLAKELEDSGPLSAERRTRILTQFANVDLSLPRPVDIAGRKAERERLILEQLLAEVSQIHPLIPQRLKDEGVSSLDRLARSNVEELSLRVSNSREQAEQIATTFQGYLSSRAERGPEIVIMGKSRALAERLRLLEASAELFERAADGEDPEARRRARRQRQAEVHQLNLLLAEFGEAAMLNEIERCSVQGKIERLGRWLSEIEAG